MPSAFLRLSHSLQYFGPVIPCGIFPAALSAFQSLPHARSRATSAARPPVGLVAGVEVDFGAGGLAVAAGAGFSGAAAAGAAAGAAGLAPAAGAAAGAAGLAPAAGAAAG